MIGLGTGTEIGERKDDEVGQDYQWRRRSHSQNRKHPEKKLIFIACILARICASKLRLSPMGYHVESTFL